MRALAITVLVACNVPDEHFSKPAQTLTVTTAGDGVVASSDGAIDCGAQCSGDFPTTATVTLDAAANAGSTFAGWSGACTNASGPCTVTMDAARSVKATFYYALQIASDGGTIDFSPSTGLACTPAQGFDGCVAYPPNVVVTLTQSASVGHSFTGWSGGTCTGVGACTVVLAAPVSVIATFTTNRHAVLVSTLAMNPGTNRITFSPNGNSCDGGCASTFSFGTPVTITATPDPTNGRFLTWTDGPCAGSTTPTCSFAMPDADVMTAASFDWFARLTIGPSGAMSLPTQLTSSPTGITCSLGPPTSGTCTMGFARNATVTLGLASDGPLGWQICTINGLTPTAKWSGDCAGATTLQCTLSLSNPGTYSAAADVNC
jgi:hypothetical protein